MRHCHLVSAIQSENTKKKLTHLSKMYIFSFISQEMKNNLINIKYDVFNEKKKTKTFSVTAQVTMTSLTTVKYNLEHNRVGKSELHTF